MSNRCGKSAVAALTALLCAASAGALEKEKFFEVGSNRGHKVAYRIKGHDAFCYHTNMMTDYDGSPRAYHPANRHDKKRNPNGKALDWTANAGKPGNWWGIVTDNGNKDGQPVVQGAKDPAPGFYVSPTSLGDHTKAEKDPRRYVDAGTVPYIVLPRKAQKGKGKDRPNGASLGDFATVINLKNGKTVHAIFADSGPGEKLGEGSAALADALGKTHQEFDLVYVVYPGSKKSPAWPVPLAAIDAEGKKRLAALGGADPVKALCSASASQTR
jgi:hypothetical protein